MKIAVFGAGGIGGYFGARLAQAGGELSVDRGENCWIMRLRVHIRKVGDFFSDAYEPMSCP